MPHHFSHRHILGIQQLSKADIETVLDLASSYVEQNKKANKRIEKLAGRTIVNLFFEPSTRTRTSFEIAAKRLGADVVNVPLEHSSTKKGETLLDTALNLDAMNIDGLVLRHAESGIPQKVSDHVKSHVFNAGDGINEHPTQALADTFTLLHHKKSLQGLTVAICGDISHSRVARSNILLLTKFGVKVRTVAPPYFASHDYASYGVENFEDMKQGLSGVDAVIMLRIQHERMAAGEFAVSLKDYHQRYGLDGKKLAVAKEDVIVMHPGPINRDVELTSALADDQKHSVIREQVERGVAVRMALLDLVLTATG